jgi:hypothetical protein
MTPVLAPSSPANWRTFYTRQTCAWCQERGLFHVDTPLPICRACAQGSRDGVAVETHPSDIRYHGDAREDSEP